MFMCAHTYIHIYIYIYIYIYMCVCVCAHNQVFLLSLSHTHTHTYWLINAYKDDIEFKHVHRDIYKTKLYLTSLSLSLLHTFKIALRSHICIHIFFFSLIRIHTDASGRHIYKFNANIDENIKIHKVFLLLKLHKCQYSKEINIHETWVKGK